MKILRFKVSKPERLIKGIGYLYASLSAMTYQNIFLLTGSNLGDRLTNLRDCAMLIEEEIGFTTKQSSLYETAPWGKSDQPSFLNQALQIESKLEPETLLEACLAIEKKVGRVRQEKWGARTIDIDIIYFGNEIINKSNLKIPHPRIAERKFVLVPLNELAPNFLHPLLKKSNAQLLDECVDDLEVKIFRVDSK